MSAFVFTSQAHNVTSENVIFNFTRGLGPVVVHPRSFSRSCCQATADQRGSNYTYQSEETEPDERTERLKAEDAEQQEADTREKILRASVPFVPRHGWTKKALAAGAESEGFPAISHGMFPRGGAELVHFFYADSNRQLATILAGRIKETGEAKPMTKKFITEAVETRLRMIVPYVDTWPQAMAIMAMPQNAADALRNLGRLVDDIWYYAGDRSVDFNWYTKRVSLAAVYKSTEVYLLQDRSDDYKDTWAFLERRVADLQTFGTFVRSIPQCGTIGKEGLIGLSIMGRNVLGMNSRSR